MKVVISTTFEISLGLLLMWFITTSQSDKTMVYYHHSKAEYYHWFRGMLPSYIGDLLLQISDATCFMLCFSDA